ncbi:hypothetical protein E6O75_ATG04008 [Venturia nashicola]|uniref:Uncharacterized protein n=1 Tax=Venturia nashicola TaxID=86259 RepID=A0A4Z1P6K8_9PEZI|nr:hypothetical protein E6O75_ATG04008 [Venturia nashicola]
MTSVAPKNCCGRSTGRDCICAAEGILFPIASFSSEYILKPPKPSAAAESNLLFTATAKRLRPRTLSQPTLALVVSVLLMPALVDVLPMALRLPMRSTSPPDRHESPESF